MSEQSRKGHDETPSHFTPSITPGKRQKKRRVDATAVPMKYEEERSVQAHEMASLREGFENVTHVLEAVGRTIEAQSQRSNRLLKKFELLANALTVLPHGNERQLEALDSLQRSVEGQTVSNLTVAGSIGELRQEMRSVPRALRQLESESERTQQTFRDSLQAITSRMHISELETEARAATRFERGEEARGRRFGMAIAAGFLGIMLLGAGVVVGARYMVKDAVSAVLGQQGVHADVQGSPEWRPVNLPVASPVKESVTATVVLADEVHEPEAFVDLRAIADAATTAIDEADDANDTGDLDPEKPE
ncbi:MAG: hypothetical protein ACYS22_11425 [Planctomycetota bacterium]|jgi:hypothetical protein